jgi:hypothetical protein
MSPVASDWASAESAPGDPLAADVVVLGGGELEVVVAGGAAALDVCELELLDDEPQPATTTEAIARAAAEGLWIQCTVPSVPI